MSVELSKVENCKDCAYWRHPVEDMEPAPVVCGRAQRAMERLVLWLTYQKHHGRKNLRQQLAVRSAVLTYSVRPDTWDGMTQAQIGRVLGISRVNFTQSMRRFRKFTGFRPPRGRPDRSR